jgi:hypothetical protein
MGKIQSAYHCTDGLLEINTNFRICFIILQAIKKAKDFETRKIVRRLKQAKERSEENLVQQLEKELQEAKEISIESIADTIDDGCDDGNRTLLENRIFKSKVVQEQLLDFSNLKEKLQHAIDTRLAGDGVAEKTIEVNLAKAKDAIGCSTMTSAGMSVHESVIQIPVVWDWSTILTASL